MTTTELDEVSALLARVLPDPSGFAERLLQQVMDRWGIPTDDHLGRGGSNGGSTGASEHIDAARMAFAPRYQPESLDALADSNVLLASALGACDCWGLQSDCVVCKGEGSSGWTQPDVELFQAFVGPAVEKLAGTDVDGREPRGAAADGNQDPTRRGESG